MPRTCVSVNVCVFVCVSVRVYVCVIMGVCMCACSSVYLYALLRECVFACVYMKDDLASYGKPLVIFDCAVSV